MASGSRFFPNQNSGSPDQGDWRFREVSTRGSSLVITIVYSYWAEKLPVSVNSVQPSSAVVVDSEEVDTNGSMVMT